MNTVEPLQFQGNYLHIGRITQESEGFLHVILAVLPILQLFCGLESCIVLSLCEAITVTVSLGDHETKQYKFTHS